MAGRISSSEREARRLYVHDRHRMVVTIVLSALIIALVVAIPTAAGLFDTTAEDNAQPNYGVVAPCVATGTTSVTAANVTVRVLNGTDKAGLANAVASALRLRGFSVQGVDNYSGGTMDRTEIRFGKNAIASAYTLLGNFDDAILRMDDRDDALIDVIVGESFYDLMPSDQVTTLSGTTLESLKNCVAADAITDVPAALEHNPVAVDSGETADGSQSEDGEQTDQGGSEEPSTDQE